MRGLKNLLKFQIDECLRNQQQHMDSNKIYERTNNGYKILSRPQFREIEFFYTNLEQKEF